jgi:hypothetical protein
MARLAADPGVAGARSELERVLRLTRQKNLDAKGYLTFVRQDASVLTRLARAYFQQTNEKDVLGVLAAAKELAASKSAPQAQIIHLSLLNRLDAAQTVRQKKHGDVAEIPQDLRWLRGLLVNALGSEATGAVSAIDDFLAGFERRKFGVERFPALLKGQLETLQLLAAKDTGGEARKRLDRIPWQANPAAVQQAHHDMLMAVYHAIGG